ncbi:MAG: aldo/keto reductase [Candidatus Brocadiia bacterium]|jgi:aryl-alcohol dehydrogenase-like predicted oxidoreductase
MKQVTFGKTGVKVSHLCLGTMMFGRRTDEAEASRIISAALDAGVNFVDTAAMYGEGAAEELLGRILKPARKKVFLATKVHRGIDAEAITQSIEESLRRLQTDFVDLYMIHWPKKGMKPMEVMEALDRVVKSGKARFVGCCNYPAWLFCYSNAISRLHGWTELVCNQVPYNPIERGVEVEVLPQALAEGSAITIYRTLLIGLLAGKYQPGGPIPKDSRAETDERITDWLDRYTSGMRFLLELAARRGVSPVHVAIAWVSSCPAVTCPIVGASRLDQLEDSLKASDFELTAEERDGISRAFGAEVKEESGGAYAELRRELYLTS